MTIKTFIKKWNVAYESREQQVEFSKEMEYDLKMLLLCQQKPHKEFCKCPVKDETFYQEIKNNLCFDCHLPIF